jgi:cob(I)alamin adenosyltransferase
MVKLDKIYTRGGDRGETSLGEGSRLPKHAPRIAALGEIDEANAAIGVARAASEDRVRDDALAAIQNELFDLGADLCVPLGDTRTRLRVTEAQVSRLEAALDAINEPLPPLDSFVLPGGSHEAAALHLARTVVRRAERALCALAAAEPVNPAALAYLNRLSDFLFVAARAANDRGKGDVKWRPGMTA